MLDVVEVDLQVQVDAALVELHEAVRQRVLCLAPVVVHRRLENNIVLGEGSIGQVSQVALIKGLNEAHVLNIEPLNKLVDVSVVEALEYTLRDAQAWLVASFNALHNRVREETVHLGISEVLDEVEVRVRLNHDVPHHQINGLSALMVVDGAEHFESLVVDHLDRVHVLYLVGQTVVNYARTLEDQLAVNFVLVADSVQAHMIVVATQIVEFIDVERVALVCNNLEHPLAVIVLRHFAFDEARDQLRIQTVILGRQLPLVDHIVEEHLRRVLMLPIVDLGAAHVFAVQQHRDDFTVELVREGSVAQVVHKARHSHILYIFLGDPILLEALR